MIGGNHALQAPVHAQVHQAAQVHQPFVAKDDFGRRAIKSEHADFHVVRVMFSEIFQSNDEPSMDSGTATPR